MNQNPLADAVAALAAPVVESLGLVIWGVEIVQSGRMVVRLFVAARCKRPADPADARYWPMGRRQR